MTLLLSRNCRITSSEEDDEMEEEEDAVEGLANSSSEQADNDSVETE